MIPSIFTLLVLFTYSQLSDVSAESCSYPDYITEDDWWYGSHRETATQAGFYYIMSFGNTEAGLGIRSLTFYGVSIGSASCVAMTKFNRTEYTLIEFQNGNVMCEQLGDGGEVAFIRGAFTSASESAALSADKCVQELRSVKIWRVLVKLSEFADLDNVFPNALPNPLPIGVFQAVIRDTSGNLRCQGVDKSTATISGSSLKLNLCPTTNTYKKPYQSELKVISHFVGPSAQVPGAVDLGNYIVLANVRGDAVEFYCGSYSINGDVITMSINVKNNMFTECWMNRTSTFYGDGFISLKMTKQRDVKNSRSKDNPVTSTYPAPSESTLSTTTSITPSENSTSIVNFSIPILPTQVSTDQTTFTIRPNVTVASSTVTSGTTTGFPSTSPKPFVGPPCAYPPEMLGRQYLVTSPIPDNLADMAHLFMRTVVFVESNGLYQLKIRTKPLIEPPIQFDCVAMLPFESSPYMFLHSYGGELFCSQALCRTNALLYRESKVDREQWAGTFDVHDCLTVVEEEQEYTALIALDGLSNEPGLIADANCFGFEEDFQASYYQKDGSIKCAGDDHSRAHVKDGTLFIRSCGTDNSFEAPHLSELKCMAQWEGGDLSASDAYATYYLLAGKDDLGSPIFYCVVGSWDDDEVFHLYFDTRDRHFTRCKTDYEHVPDGDSYIVYSLRAHEFSRCRPSDCQNGGECHMDPFYNEATCICPPGYHGDRCEYLPRCLTHGCMHGAECSPTENHIGYLCTCAEGFHGVYCEHDFDECKYQPCLPGGECHNTMGSYYCICDGTDDYATVCAGEPEMTPCPEGEECDVIGVGPTSQASVVTLVVIMVLALIVVVMIIGTVAIRCKQRMLREEEIGSVTSLISLDKPDLSMAKYNSVGSWVQKETLNDDAMKRPYVTRIQI